MKKFYIFIFISTLYMYSDAYALNEHSLNDEDYYEYSTGNSYDIDAKCTKPGPLCKSCTELVNCIKLGAEDFLEVPLKTCGENNTEHGKDNEYCLIDKCSTDPNPQCTNVGASAFECHNTGVYPDPLDCRIYHMCVEKKHSLTNPGETSTTSTQSPSPDDILALVDLTAPTLEDIANYVGVQCDAGYGYNPITTYCDKKLQNGVCSGTPVPPCKDKGQMGPIPGTSIFYVCMEDKNGNIVPNLYMCPHGSKFINGGCA